MMLKISLYHWKISYLIDKKLKHRVGWGNAPAPYKNYLNTTKKLCQQLPIKKTPPTIPAAALPGEELAKNSVAYCTDKMNINDK